MAFAQAPEPAHDADFLDRLRLPRTRRDDDASWEPKRPRPTVVPIRDEREVHIERLERSLEELTARLDEMQFTVDELTDTLEGLQGDLPPARWRIPLRVRKLQ